MKRYNIDIVEHGEYYSEMEEDPEGEWVKTEYAETLKRAFEMAVADSMVCPKEMLCDDCGLGTISDYECAKRMIKHYLEKANEKENI